MDKHPSPQTEPIDASSQSRPDSQEERLGYSPFPIVGIGASAGGLEAFSELLGNLPERTGMAFLLVQHLDPAHPSRLKDLLGKVTRIPIQEASDGMEVKPDHIYTIPPNTDMGIKEGRLRITPRPQSRGPHLPVDFLFRRLAEEQQSRAIGVVLSGTGSDGTLGLGEIKAVGGISFAQDEATAQHAGMPQSARDSGSADFVLAPDQIAKRLAEIGNHPYLAPAEHVKVRLEPDDEYKKVLDLVRRSTGVDFSLYRDTTIGRRIMRRMALRGYQSLADYARLLEKSREEIEALYGDLLINVTSFFREPAMFEALKTQVFPEIIKHKEASTPIRIWVPGCSAGQEAYSIAMALWEFLDDSAVRPPVQIFATDLCDSQAVEKARLGLYPENIEAEVSPPRLKRFFQRESGYYRIDKSIRDACVFARHNVAADPPFSHLDLISCRNVLIYMSPSLQKRVLPIFHYALDVPGYLVLGAAESIGEFADMFESVDYTNRIYVKKTPVNRLPVLFQAGHFLSTMPQVARPRIGPAVSLPDFQKEAERIVLGRYGPPFVLVNHNFDVVLIRGRLDRYLRLPQGEPTANLLKLAPEGLFLELRNALNEARRSQQPVRREDVRLDDDQGTRLVSMEVVPVKPTNQQDICLLVMFHEPGKRQAPTAAGQTMGGNWLQRLLGKAPAQAKAAAEPNDSENARVRQELAAMREYIQSLIEQQEGASEELKSANEEILSSNEELQSTNEELQTAKEELQSGNEELSTVNEQLQQRNVELSKYTNDLNNLLSSTMIPVVMVGSDLRIRLMTPPAKSVMNLLPTDVGRPISDIKSNVLVPELEKLLEHVIEHVTVQVREVQDREGRWYALRLHPYRTADNKIDGAVVVLFDINDVKLAEQEARESRTELESKLRALSRLHELTMRLVASPDLRAALTEVLEASILMLDADMGIIRLYDPQTHLLEVMVQRGFKEDYVNRLSGERDERSAVGQAVLKKERIVVEDVESSAEYEPRRALAALAGYRAVQATPLVGRLGRVLGVLSTHFRRPHRPSEAELRMLDLYCRLAIDFIERVRADEALKLADQRKNQFLAMLAHELRNPLGPVRNAIQIMSLTDDPSQIRQARDTLDRQFQQLSRIVDDLLDVSRIIQGKIEIRKRRVALDRVVASALESSRSLITARGQNLSVDMPSEPIEVQADPERLVQVLTNLLNNAAKFTGTEGNILLTAERDNAKNEVAISIRDTGIGIPPELMPRIFDIFSQGDQSLERTRGGLGLGLALVRSLMEMQGGTVEAKSPGPGQGSTFTVHLPVAAPGSRAEEAPARGDHEPVTAAKRRRILVVDDNQDQAQSLGMLLELLGHEVKLAYDGRDAVAIAREFVPDMALVDIGLPGLNGFDVARRLREQPELSKIMLVAQTGWGQEEDRRRTHEAGFDRHLVKPVEIAAVQEILAGIK